MFLILHPGNVFVKKNSPQNKKKPPVATAKAKIPAKDYSKWLIGITLLLTLIVYIPAFKAGFVNWDDDDYVGNNPFIRGFSHMNELLTKPVQGNYHPLTMLSLAFSFTMSGDKPWAYHLLNVIIHLLNTFLVYKLASRLSKGSNIISFTTALLFGIHPMHVESVAWVSERKDVLYAFFFLLGLISYLKYIDSQARKDYFFSLLWFLLSLASKPAAIVFPVALFAFDFFRNRKWSGKLILEKIPFLVFSALLTYLTIAAQATAGATDTDNFFPLEKRIFFPFYGVMMYLFKLIVPVNLSAFYSLPAVNVSLPSLYYASPVIGLIALIVCLMTLKKYPVVMFAFAFFIINLVLVLQFKVIGGAIMADRYTYIPYIGMFFLIGWMLDKKFRPQPSTAYMILGVVGLTLTVVGYNQAMTWTTSTALWDNAIKSAPSDRAYIHRATFYRKAGNPDKALELYNEAIRINKISHGAYCNRANIYFDRGQDSLAMEGYNMSLSIKPDYAPALDNRGALLARQGKFKQALVDLNHALQINPDYLSAYPNRALVFYELGQIDSSLKDCYTYLKYKPLAHDIYNSISICYQKAGKYNESIDAINKAIKIDPQPIYFLNRSFSWNALGKMDEAKKDALYARQNGVEVPPSFAARLGI